MQDEINSTEVKPKSNKKHFPLIDLTNIKPTFLESLSMLS